MNTHAEKATTHKSQAASNSFASQSVGNNSTLKLQDNRPQSIIQQKQVDALANKTNAELIQKKANNTGLPYNLKAGVENLSGFSMDDVKVHFNSAKPAQLQAHAYAQGTDIHIAPGQEKHLPHEAWHVVQQKQGRVKATMQMKGEYINDNRGLEREADLMGAKSINNNPLSITQKKSKDVVCNDFSVIKIPTSTKEDVLQLNRKRKRNRDGAWSLRSETKGTGHSGAGKQGMNTVDNFSGKNIGAIAYSGVDNILLGGISDVVDWGSQMWATDKDDTWGQAIGRRAEATFRTGATLAAKVAATYLGGIPAYSGIAAARHVYPAISDRVAAEMATKEGNDSTKDQKWGEYFTRKYYRIAHGEDIHSSGWQDVTKSSGESRETKRTMGDISASAQAGGIKHKTNRFMSRQWTHLIGDSLGGKTEQSNLTAASHGANIAMTPGEEHLNAHTSSAEVKTTAFERADLPVARGLNFQGKIGGKRQFNQNIDAARWPLSKAEQARLRIASDGTSMMPSVVREIPVLSKLFGKSP